MVEFGDIKPEYIKLLEGDFNTLRELTRGFEACLEVGTFRGGSAVAMAINANYVWTIDIYDRQPKIWDILGPPFTERISFFKGTSVDFAEAHPTKECFDCLFVDGSHEYSYVEKDIEALVPLVKKGGLVMFHDYRPGADADVTHAVDDYIKEQKPEMVKEAIPGTDLLLVLRKR